MPVINVEDEQGRVHQHDVSDEYMEFCFARAKHIATALVDNPNPDEFERLVEESPDDTQKSVVASMTIDILSNSIMKFILKKMLKDIVEGM